jgi:hypothetical protein
VREGISVCLPHIVRGTVRLDFDEATVNPIHNSLKIQHTGDQIENHCFGLVVLLLQSRKSERVTASRQQNSQHVKRGSFVAVDKPMIAGYRLDQSSSFARDGAVVPE